MTYCINELVFVKERGVQWPAQVMSKHKGGTYTVELYHPDNNTVDKRTDDVIKLYSRKVRACELTRWNQDDADAYASTARDYLVAIRDAENSIESDSDNYGLTPEARGFKRRIETEQLEDSARARARKQKSPRRAHEPCKMRVHRHLSNTMYY